MTDYTPEEIHLSCELSRWVEKRRLAQLSVAELVADCRKAGMSWSRIALALGVSSQSAWERYGLTPRQRQERSLQNDTRVTQPVLDGLPDVPVSHQENLGPKPKRKQQAKERRYEH